MATSLMPLLTSRTLWIAGWLAALGLCKAWPVNSQGKGTLPAPVQVSFKEQAYPGGVVRVDLQSSRDIAQIECALSEQRLVFQPAAVKGQWTALAGIDLETKPGLYLVKGAVTFQDGRKVQFDKSLRVLHKSFPVQRIAVEEKYVTLAAEDQKRADEESKKLQALWKRATPEKLWQGQYLSPVEGALTSGFGRRRVVNNQPRSPHSGVDLKASTGTPIRAANFAKVALAEDLFFSGNTVVLDHGLGLYTFYAHCSKILVKAGTMVNKGDVIAEVGATGRVTGPHLHWACRLNEARVNPLDLTQTWMSQ